MNRREMFASLAAIPVAATTRIVRAELKPSDVIVIECPGHISQETAERIKSTALEAWPNHKVLVMGDGLQLKVVAGD